MGDIYGTLKFSDGTTYRDRFTLIKNLPFDGIIGIQLLQNRNFQIMKDGKNVKLGNSILPRVSGSDIIATMKDCVGTIPSGTESLACPQMESNTIKWDSKMIPHPRNDQPIKGNNQPARKPPLNPIYPVFSMPAEGLKRREDALENRTLARHVGKSMCPDSVPSNSDVNKDFSQKKNVEKLFTATPLPSPKHLASLRNTLLKHLDVFSSNDDDLGCFVSTDGGPSSVNFEVRDPTVFVHSIPRRVPYERRVWLEEKLEAMKRNGIIEEVQFSGNSLQVSPIVIVPKKNGKYRMAVDYREINKNLKPSTVPLPCVKDCIECLGGKKYFSALDITSAFNQVKLTEETKDLLGFVTLNRRFKTHRMPFGVLCCPGEFQLIVSRTLRAVPKEDLTVYLDDILIHTKTLENHIEMLDLVFKEIRRHGLKLNPLKCDLIKENIEYLGFKVGHLGGIKYGYQPLEGKIKAIRECPLPTTPKEVRQFCGSLQYYNSIIKGLNVQLSPLHRGSAKKPFTMTKEMKAAFQTVKNLLAEEISLTFPDFRKPFTLTTDASYSGAAGILTQDNGDGPEIIYTFSKTFTEVESRWAIVELELLALVWSLEKMRVLLLGRRFTWITDSLVLKQMIEKPPSKDMSRSGRKISRFLDFISEFDFECVHIKGNLPPTQMADFLSRAPIAAIQNLFRIQLTKDQWKEALAGDEDLIKLKGPWSRYAKQCFWEDDLIFVNKRPRAKLAVPMSLRGPVIAYYHENFTMHAGISRVIQLITPLFIWPEMYAEIREYINACKTCSQAKPRQAQEGVTMEIEVPGSPMEWIQVDLVVLVSPRNKSNCQYLLTAICTLTNYFLIQPLAKKTGPDVIRALGRLFCVGGVPKIIQSDNGKEFKNSVVQQHANWLGVQWRFSTPYKPSTQGRVERRHAELSKLLRILKLDYEQIEEEIPYIQLELNSAQDKITQLSPFEAFHGWAPRIPHVLKDFPIGTHSLHPMDLNGEMCKLSWEEELRESQCRTFTAIKQQHQATRYQNTLGRNIKPQLAPGDWVMVKNRVAGKLDSRAQGPFKVVRVNRGGTVHIQNDSGKIQRLPPDLVYRYVPQVTEKGLDPYSSSDEEVSGDLDLDKLYNPDQNAKTTRPPSLRQLTVPNYSKFF